MSAALLCLLFAGAESSLPSGVSLIHVERSTPYPSFALLVPIGSDTDPPGKAGLAYASALAIEESIRAATADELPRAFEQLGGTIEARTGPHASIFYGGAPADRFDEAMAIVFRALARPVFDAQAVLGRAAFERRSRSEDPIELARIEARRLLFGFSSTEGELSELASMARADLEALLAERTKAESIILAIAGPASAVAGAAAWTAVLPKGRVPAAPRPAPVRARGRRLIVVDRADPAGALIMIARPLSPPSADKLPALFAGAASIDVLGSRAELDLLLGMSTIAVRSPGASISTIGKTTKGALAALDRWRHGPSSDAIALAKKRAATRAEVALADPSTQVLALATTRAAGRTVSSRDQLAANILVAKETDVALFARNLSSGDDLAIVVVAGATQDLVRELAGIPGVRDVSIVSSER